MSSQVASAEQVDNGIDFKALSAAGAINFEHLLQEKWSRHMPGTRIWLLMNIRKWIRLTEDKPTGTSRSIFWLVGAGGTGKTVVASQLVKQESKDVVAFHFCRFNNLEQNKPAAIIRSISAMLRVRLPGFFEALGTEATNEPTGNDMDELFERLLQEPLSKIGEPTSRKLVVIDALDELPKGEVRSDLLSLITNKFSLLPSWIRILLTSRPESEIRSALEEKFKPVELHVDDPNNQEDVRAFLRKLAQDYADIEFSIERLEKDVEDKFGLRPGTMKEKLRWLQTPLLSSKAIYDEAMNKLLKEPQFKEGIEKICPKLNPNLRQDSNDLKLLYKQAGKTQKVVREWFNKSFDSDCFDLIESNPPLKGRERTEEKIRNSYGGDCGNIRDISRFTLCFNKPTYLFEVYEKLSNEEDIDIAQLKNKYLHPSPLGYCDLNANLRVKLPDDTYHICEVQINLKEMLDAKKKCHCYYEEIRSEIPKLLEDSVVKLDAAKVQEYILHRLCNPAIEVVVDKLADKAQGLFQYAVLLEDELKKRIDEDPGRKIDFDDISALPSGLYELYNNNFRRSFPNGEGWEDCKALIACVCTAPEPMPLAILEPVLGKCLELIGRVSLVFPVLSDGKIHAMHKSVVDFVEGRMSDGEGKFIISSNEIKEAHMSLGRACLDLIAPSGADLDTLSGDRSGADCEEHILLTRSGVGSVVDNEGCMLPSSAEGCHVDAQSEDMSLAESEEKRVCCSFKYTCSLFSRVTPSVDRNEWVNNRTGNGSVAIEEEKEIEEDESHGNEMADVEAETKMQKRMEEDEEKGSNRQFKGKENNELLMTRGGNCIEYAMKHVVVHVCSGDVKTDVDQVRELLLSFGWLLRKVTEVGPYETMVDCATFLKHRTDRAVYLIKHALQLSLSALYTDPRQLASQFVGGRLSMLHEEEDLPEITKIVEEVNRMYIPWGEGMDGGEHTNDERHSNIAPRWWMPTTKCLTAAGNPMLSVFAGDCGRVFSVRWSPDGSMIASGSGSPDGVSTIRFKSATVTVWEVETGRRKHVLKGHSDVVLSVCWSPDSSMIASGSDDKTVMVWEVETGRRKHVLKYHGGKVTSVSWSPDGTKIALGISEKLYGKEWSGGDCVDVHSNVVNSVVVWEMETGKYNCMPKGHRDGVNSVHWSPDGNKIASGSDDKTVRVWNVKDGNCIHTFEGHSDTVYSISSSRDDENSVGVFSVCFSPDGTNIASGSSDKTVMVWDAETGRRKHVFEGHSGTVWSVDWSPDGKNIASGSHDRTVVVWDVETGRRKQVFEGHIDEVNSVNWSHDSRMIVSGSFDKTVVVWDAETGRHNNRHSALYRVVMMRLFGFGRHNNHVTEGHSEKVWRVRFSPDGTKIASCSEDKTVRVWDVEGGRCIHVLEGHSNKVYSVGWSRDGKYIVSGGGFGDNTVRVWDVERGRCIRVLEGHRHCVMSVCWSHDGKKIRSEDYYFEVRVWDVERGECLKTGRKDDFQEGFAVSSHDKSHFPGNDISFSIDSDTNPKAYFRHKACVAIDINKLHILRASQKL